MFIVYCYMFNEWGLFPFGIVLFLKLPFFPPPRFRVQRYVRDITGNLNRCYNLVKIKKWLIFNNKIYECSLSGKERKQGIKIIKSMIFR